MVIEMPCQKSADHPQLEARKARPRIDRFTCGGLIGVIIVRVVLRKVVWYVFYLQAAAPRALNVGKPFSKSELHLPNNEALVALAVATDSTGHFLIWAEASAGPDQTPFSSLMARRSPGADESARVVQCMSGLTTPGIGPV